MKIDSGGRKTISIVIFVFSLIMLSIAVFQKYKVHDPGVNEFGILTFYRVSERQITIDATFHGVERKDDGHLYTTYDRLSDAGKRACPT